MVKIPPVIAAIGNFDGVHRGHAALIAQTKAFAAEHGAQTGVVLFDPHPRRYFRPDEAPFLLTSPSIRDGQLRAHGVDKIMALNFDKKLAMTEPEDFIGDILARQLGLAGIVAGADFRFGAKRAGDGIMLRTVGTSAGLKVKLVELLNQSSDGEKFGSSGVRNALANGDLAQAKAILGRPWAINGTIIRGEQVGRTIGFATANIDLGDIIAPRKGVYAVRVMLGGENYTGVANYGRRPTVGGVNALLEVHIFDFAQDIYGADIEVTFVEYLRDEQKFDGLDALKAQIADDSAQARKILG